MKCPICRGAGHIAEPHVNTIASVLKKKRLAKILRKNGYSLRQIQHMIGWKSVRSVTEALEGRSRSRAIKANGT